MEQKETQNTPSIQINAQYVKDLSFEAPGLPFIMSEMKNPPKISVDIDVKANKANDTIYTVDLVVSIKANKSEDNKAIFICELTYGAMVTLNVPAEHIEPVLLVEIPHLLFPYARAIVANITRESGLPPLQINPIDFASLYRNKQQNQTDKDKN